MTIRAQCANACAASFAMLLAGCSGSSGLSTGSLFGGTTEAAATTAAQPSNDPTSRAFQVGTVSARAVKCGYNFDPLKLRTTFLATEAAALPVADLAKVEKVYDTAYNGVTRAVAGEPNYCTAEKTADIKSSLTRHLAGDYTPSPRKVVPDDGLFSNWGSGPDKGPSFGSEDWWSKQNEALGG